MNVTGIVNAPGTSGSQRSFQMALADVTNTQPNSHHIQTRQRKTINNMCRLCNNLYNDFEAASSTSTALPDSEMHDHSFIREHANDPLQQIYEGFSDDNIENASDNNLNYYIK